MLQIARVTPLPGAPTNAHTSRTSGRGSQGSRPTLPGSMPADARSRSRRAWIAFTQASSLSRARSRVALPRIGRTATSTGGRSPPPTRFHPTISKPPG